MTAPRTEPLIDTHFHLWDLATLRRPWLDGPSGDGLDALKRDWLPADYADLALPLGVTAAVHVETNPTPADALAETLWLARVLPDIGIPVAIVAFAAMSEAATASLLRKQSAVPGVVGIRDILTWHPDPARTRMPDNDRMADPVFRTNMAVCADLGLGFELLISAHQAREAEALVAAFPGIEFVLEHCMVPMDHDPAGMALWRDGLARMADHGNVTLKISDPMAYRPDWTEAWVADIVGDCLAAFGPARAMWGSDWPVTGLNSTFSDWHGMFHRAIAGLDQTARAQIRHDVAASIYRLQP